MVRKLCDRRLNVFLLLASDPSIFCMQWQSAIELAHNLCFAFDATSVDATAKFVYARTRSHVNAE